MARKFYLSLVYDADGYNRFDLASKSRLQEMDLLMSNFKNREEVVEAYLSEYNIDKKKGKLCIIYEDTDVKKREMSVYGPPENHPKEEIANLYSYAHIIPVLYKDERLMNIDACLLTIKEKLHNHEIRDSIMINHRSKDGKYFKTNKRYLFETEEEQDYISRLNDYDNAIYLFLRRIKKASEDDKYFYCRSLMKICGLKIKEKKKVTNIKINKKKLNEIISSYELTESEKLERETINMDEFYLHHDLDEVIKLSPNSNRPIGSEGKKRR